MQRELYFFLCPGAGPLAAGSPSLSGLEVKTMESKGAAEVGWGCRGGGVKGLHGCRPEVAEAVLCRAFGNLTAPLDGLWLWADKVTFGDSLFLPT